MSAGNDPDFDAMFGDIPADSPETEAAAPEAAEGAVAAEEGAAAEAEKPAETPAEPAQPERPRGPKKPWWDIYTAMLALTLVAIVLGCVFLLLELSRYNFETTPSPTPPAPTSNG